MRLGGTPIPFGEAPKSFIGAPVRFGGAPMSLVGAPISFGGTPIWFGGAPQMARRCPLFVWGRPHAIRGMRFFKENGRFTVKRPRFDRKPLGNGGSRSPLCPSRRTGLPKRHLAVPAQRGSIPTGTMKVSGCEQLSLIV
jgi:hypothetical protein